MEFIPLYNKHPENTIIGTIKVNKTYKQTAYLFLDNEFKKLVKQVYNNNSIDTIGVEFYLFNGGCKPLKQSRIFNIHNIIKELKKWN